MFRVRSGCCVGRDEPLRGAARGSGAVCCLSHVSTGLEALPGTFASAQPVLSSYLSGISFMAINLSLSRTTDEKYLCKCVGQCTYVVFLQCISGPVIHDKLKHWYVACFLTELRLFYELECRLCPWAPNVGSSLWHGVGHVPCAEDSNRGPDLALS